MQRVKVLIRTLWGTSRQVATGYFGAGLEKDAMRWSSTPRRDVSSRRLACMSLSVSRIVSCVVSCVARSVVTWRAAESSSR